MSIAKLRRLLALCYASSCIGLLLTGAGEAQTFFSEVTQEAIWALPSEARSIAFGDYNNDGWPDLFVAEDYTTLHNRLSLLSNEGNGRFAHQTAAIQEEIPTKAKGGGAIFGDYDNDGDQDLLVPIGGFLDLGLNMLLRNDRGVLREMNLSAGLVDRHRTDNAIWLDYNRDGHLDLYMGNPYAPNILYRNNGDGTFTDATEEAGLNVELSPAGGSNGGIAAGDYNDDGWPDLFVTVWNEPNRLFLSDGKGRFADATTDEIADPGQAYGVAAGDIDNDGDLDLFHAAFGFGNLLYRSDLYLNLGGGEFLNVTEAVGLSALNAAQLLGANFGDIDNDGDLDLLTTNTHFLYLNNGDGTFSDRTSASGMTDIGGTLSFGDYDLDGFLDVLLGGDASEVSKSSFVELYRNNGNANHWLRVELVGVESNRNGIGARLISTTGDLRQMREIMGGFGFNQDEMVAHFGLGERTQVDELEIRWPSGQVDVLTDIPADQKIRVIEGRGTYHAIEPTRWEAAPPDSAVLDSQVKLDLAVRPALFEPDASITEVTADLSPFGGVEGVPLKAVGDGSYHLRDISLSIEGVHGWRALSVMVDQATSLGNYWIKLSRQIAVLPSRDTAVFNENAPGEWQVEVSRKVKTTDLAEAGVVHTGSVSGAFQVEESLSGWSITFRPETSVEPLGYSALRFAIRPGDVSLPDVPQTRIALNPGKDIDLLDRGWLDLNRREWQIVEIPLSSFDRKEKIESIFLFGTFGGMLYLDDIRLVAAAAPPAPSATAVLEEQIATLPQSVTLDQNYPNPFNSSTIIRFALPADEEIELAVFNLTGQKVATLAEGVREASSYTVHWDGRDDSGHLLSSGVYLYRLRAGQRHIETRKLLLLR